MRQGGWKLIDFFEDNSVQLYDLASDPSEQKNLAEQEPARAKEMRASLSAWREQVAARMPVTNPEYDPARADELAGIGRNKRQKKP